MAKASKVPCGFCPQPEGWGYGVFLAKAHVCSLTPPFMVGFSHHNIKSGFSLDDGGLKSRLKPPWCMTVGVPDLKVGVIALWAGIIQRAYLPSTIFISSSVNP